MTLKEICLNNLVKMIKNLPPLLQEEVIGKSKKDIESDARLKVINDIKHNLPYIVEDMVSDKIKEIEGIYMKRKNAYPNTSQDILIICENTTNNVIRLIENKVMNNVMHTADIYSRDTDTDTDIDY